MKGLNFELETLYFSTFRKPTSTSLMLSYLIPPFTTIRGLLSNALGLVRDDFRLQDEIKIGVSIQSFGIKSREMAKILKLKEMPGERTVEFPSSPMFKELLYGSRYIIYIGGQEEIIENIYNHLLNPKRPLYIGQSDDLVDLKINKPIEVDKIETTHLDSVVEGIIPGAVVEKIPYKFEKIDKGYKLEYKILSLFCGSISNLKQSIYCFKFAEKNIALI